MAKTVKISDGRFEKLDEIKDDQLGEASYQSIVDVAVDQLHDEVVGQ